MTLQQKSFSNLVEEFPKAVMAMIKCGRLDTQLVGFVEEVDEIPTQLPRFEGPARFHAHGEEIESPVLKMDSVAIESIDWKYWLREWSSHSDELFNPYSSQVGKLVVDRENLAIVNGLLSQAGRLFSNGDIRKKYREAVKWIEDNGYYPDRFLIHPSDFQLLQREKVILSVGGSIEQKGSHFLGVADGGLDVYWTPSVERGTAIIYEKSQIVLKRKPPNGPKIYFDKHPEYLIIKEECALWSLDKKTIARTSFIPED